MAKLENELWEAVEALVSSLSAFPEAERIVPCLQELEDCLMRVEPSHAADIQNALGCAIQALGSQELLQHHDVHVRVFVASCFNQILKIMALDVRCCSDELIKKVLGLIVSAFDEISDPSSGLHHKWISILKTFAKARSCILMADLECYKLIVDMFKYFLGNIRENQPDIVFSSMGLIMILVLEEMKQVPFELLLTLLHAVKNGNKGILPVARKLAERVLENCDMKLAPHMNEAVRLMGFPLEDYSRVVAHVCAQAVETSEIKEVLGSEGDAASEECMLTRKPNTSSIVNTFLKSMGNVYALEKNSSEDVGVVNCKSVIAESNTDKRSGCQEHDPLNKLRAEAANEKAKTRNDCIAKLINDVSSPCSPVETACNVSASVKICNQTNLTSNPNASSTDQLNSHQNTFLESMESNADKRSGCQEHDPSNKLRAEAANEEAKTQNYPLAKLIRENTFPCSPVETACNVSAAAKLTSNPNASSTDQLNSHPYTFLESMESNADKRSGCQEHDPSNKLRAEAANKKAKTRNFPLAKLIRENTFPCFPVETACNVSAAAKLTSNLYASSTDQLNSHPNTFLERMERNAIKRSGCQKRNSSNKLHAEAASKMAKTRDVSLAKLIRENTFPYSPVETTCNGSAAAKLTTNPNASSPDQLNSHPNTFLESMERSAVKRSGCQKLDSLNKLHAEAANEMAKTRDVSLAKLITENTCPYFPVETACNVSAAAKVCNEINSSSLSVQQSSKTECISSQQARSNGSHQGGTPENGVSIASNGTNEEESTSSRGDKVEVAKSGGSSASASEDSSIKNKFLGNVCALGGNEEHTPEPNFEDGQNVYQPKDAALDLPGMQDHSSQCGLQSKADSLSGHTQKSLNMDEINMLLEDLPLRDLVHHRSKKARPTSQRKRRFAGAQLPVLK